MHSHVIGSCIKDNIGCTCTCVVVCLCVKIVHLSSFTFKLICFIVLLLKRVVHRSGITIYNFFHGLLLIMDSHISNIKV